MKVIKFKPLPEAQKSCLGYAWIESPKQEVYHCVRVLEGKHGKFPGPASFYIDDKFEPGFQYIDHEMQKKFRKALSDALKAHIEEYGFTAYDEMPQQTPEF